ncbi:MAG TPA: M23 family metallopeptidase [Jiangellaceae bacterium]
MAAATTGVVTMPEEALSTAVAEGKIAPDRPQSEQVLQGTRLTATDTGSLDAIVAASGTIASESTEGIEQAHETIRQEQRQKAAEREARRTREARKYVRPLEGYRVSASFGSTGSLWVGAHTGIDLSASYGSSVVSVTTGEIIFAGWDGSYGYKIVVRHWDGTETWYCHLSRIIQRSGTVSPGDVIGAVGSTGNSTGPHLHFEVHPSGGGAIDPRPFMADMGVDI